MQTQTDGRIAGAAARKADETAEQYTRRLDRTRKVRSEVADRLARLYTLLEDRDIAPPVVVVLGGGFVSADWSCPDPESFQSVLRAIGSSIDNPWNKHSANGSYRMTQTRDGVAFEVSAAWVTCDQVQVGTKVEETTEVVEPAKTRTVVEEVPVYEWRCPDSALLSELADGQETVDPAEIGAG